MNHRGTENAEGERLKTEDRRSNDSTPQRIQMRRVKGWRKPANTVYVGRPTMWHNPYLVCARRPREEAVRAFRMGVRGRWKALQRLEGHSDISMLTVRAYFQAIRVLIGDLRGKNLACWCPLDKCCHADVLLELANESTSEPINQSTSERSEP